MEFLQEINDFSRPRENFDPSVNSYNLIRYLMDRYNVTENEANVELNMNFNAVLAGAKSAGYI